MLHSVLWLSYSKRVYLVRGFRPLRTFIFNRRFWDSAGYFRLHLKDSKTDPFHRFVFLGSSGRPICAVTALPLYLGIRGSSHGPPFMCQNCSPLSPLLVNFWLRSIVAAGISEIIPVTVFELMPLLRPSKLEFLII